ncbi:MAG: 1-acyl-sn-glycerol-3-phosphate acyltransferase [Dokdonella sp.]
MPQQRQNGWRRLAFSVLTRAGWKVVGTFPDVPRLVLIAAPHSSWWDGVWGLLTKSALGIDLAFMGKRELFIGPLGWALRWAGGIPIERDHAHGLVGQMTERMRNANSLWLGIAPEGTRKRVARWKSGFWHIAHDAGVPILPIYFHYPEKTIGVGALFYPSDDRAADLAKLREFYAPWQGRNHGIE